jgi:hypothetical protein
MAEGENYGVRKRRFENAPERHQEFGIIDDAVMSKLSVEHSSNTLSLEEWVKNGIERLNDQKTPFPRVF